jgi:TPR repeat protein
VAKDFAESVKWYRKAADQGDSSGQYNMGWAYEHGQGVDKNLAEAKKWYQLAADQGHEGAKKQLAKI